MRKFLSLVLALVMALSLTTVAWGADPVAKIGTVEYTSLQDAVADVPTNGSATITLLDDVITDSYVFINSGKNVTIEGAGKTITFKAGGTNHIFGIAVKEASVTLDEGLSIVTAVGCAAYVQDGTLVTYANLTSTSAGHSALMTNGTCSATVTVKDGAITGNKCAIYWPSQGKLTIEGGTITGPTGVYFKSGELEITGGTINGTGDAAAYSYVDSDYIPTGDALVIENVGGTTGYEEVSSVSISGGTFSSDNASAVASYAATSVNSSAVAVDEFIEGGTFDTDVSANVATGTATAKVNGSSYVVGADNIKAAATVGAKIEMLQGSVTLNNGTTLDSTSGEYTVPQPPVYYPVYVPTVDDTTEKDVTSAQTFDAGIALYVGMSVMGAVGTVALSKKRED